MTRAKAFVAAADQAGITSRVLGVDKGAGVKECDPSALHEVIHTSVEELASCVDRPTGLFVPKGNATLAVYEALRRRNLRPGEDVTVVACDNDPSLAGLDPRIATIDVRADRVGQTAVRQLLARIDSPFPHERTLTLVEPSLLLPPEVT